MMEEARAAESRRDFISKCAIGLKEMRESHVRLRIHERCLIGPPDDVVALRAEAGELGAILMTIVKNTRRGLNSEANS
jgi:four helix bundle protein